MRIAFDVTSCAKNKGVGIAGYGRALIAACLRVAPQHEYVLGVRPNKLTKKRFVADIIPGTTARVILDWLPSLTLGSLDIFHGIGVRLPPTGSF
ncbi:MAG: hypothetical protein VX916_03125, partial [Planctomycetota bacterium]|nr:hypothetical protein [Planctomycetota bacterium]